MLDYDADKAAFWMQETGFMDHYMMDMIWLELDGYCVLEGVLGHSYQDYFGEWDEEWDFKFCRRASEEEIRTGTLENI